MTCNGPVYIEKEFTIVYKIPGPFPDATLEKCSHCSHVNTLPDYKPDHHKLYKSGVYKEEYQKNIFAGILTRVV